MRAVIQSHWTVDHPQHRETVRAEKADVRRGSERQGDHVKHRRVVERDRRHQTRIFPQVPRKLGESTSALGATMAPMARVLFLLIVALLIFGPCAAGATADFFIDGIHDPESDNVLQAVRSHTAVPAPVSLVAVNHVLVFVAVLSVTDEGAIASRPPSPRQPRAPPLA